jgi:hypothetical protein
MHFYDAKAHFRGLGKTTLKNELGYTAAAHKTSFLDQHPKTET